MRRRITTLVVVAAAVHSIALGASQASFRDRFDYQTYYSLRVVVGDVNGDGIPDRLDCEVGCSVQFGNGDGTFRPGPLYATGFFVEFAVLA